jgi:hypothetical protein
MWDEGNDVVLDAFDEGAEWLIQQLEDCGYGGIPKPGEFIQMCGRAKRVPLADLEAVQDKAPEHHYKAEYDHPATYDPTRFRK